MRKTKDGSYEYIAGFVDDVICFSKNPQAILDYLRKFYTMKGVGHPQYYLGGDVVKLPDTWDSNYGLSARTYIRNSVSNLETMCGTEFSHASTPFDDRYHPEEDTTELCPPKLHSQYPLNA